MGWKQKYEALGEIAYGRHGPNISRAHLASSKVVLHRNFDDHEYFYRNFIMQNEHNELAYLAEHGLVIRIEGVKELLEYYDQPREIPEQLPGQVEWRSTETGM